MKTESDWRDQFKTTPGPLFTEQWHSVKHALLDRFTFPPGEGFEDESLLLCQLVELLNALEYYDHRPPAEKAVIIEILHMLSDNITWVSHGKPRATLIEEPDAAVLQGFSRSLRRMVFAVAHLNHSLPRCLQLGEESAREFYVAPLIFCAELPWQLSKPAEHRQPVIDLRC